MIDHLHRGMTHTAKSLAALSDRELDALVAESVFDASPEKIVREFYEIEAAEHIEREVVLQVSPRYSTTYEGMGLVIDQMQKRGIHVNSCD